MESGIKMNKSCVSLKSNTCEQLIKHKNELFKINNDFYEIITLFTREIGLYERNSQDTLTLDIYINKDSRMTHDMSKINTNMKIIQEFINNKIIKKSISDSNQIIKTAYNLHKFDFFTTGNLSVSLISKMMYTDNDTIYNSVVKIYPIDYLLHTDKYNTIKSSHGIKRFKDFMYFLFLREGLVGCWIKNNILLKKISPTFACVYDSYVLKGLPLSYDKYNYLMMKRDIEKNKDLPKKWLKTIRTKDDWDKIQTSLFGYIEMEEIDFTLQKLMIKKNQYFDLGVIFEIVYSKLVLAFYGKEWVQNML